MSDEKKTMRRKDVCELLGITSTQLRTLEYHKEGPDYTCVAAGVTGKNRRYLYDTDSVMAYKAKMEAERPQPSPPVSKPSQIDLPIPPCENPRLPELPKPDNRIDYTIQYLAKSGVNSGIMMGKEGRKQWMPIYVKEGVAYILPDDVSRAQNFADSFRSKTVPEKS